MFCPNTGTKFREPYHLNHVIPCLVIAEVENIQLYLKTYGGAHCFKRGRIRTNVCILKTFSFEFLYVSSTFLMHLKNLIK